MSLIVNTNVHSLFTQRAISKNTFNLEKTTQKLSTGLRINQAGDDAAGLSISEKMRSEIEGLTKARQNSLDGISLTQTMDGGLGIIQDNLMRIRELFVQGLNGTNSASEKDMLQREVNERVEAIDDISSQVKFNGITLLSGNTGTSATAVNITLQTGAFDADTTVIELFAGASSAANTGINIDITQEYAAGAADYGSLVEGVSTAGLALDELHITGATGVAAAGGNTDGTLADIDAMIGNVSRMRSHLGAVQNAIHSKLDYLDIQIENVSASKARIKDADIAKESSELVKYQMLQQASVAMLQQANANPQVALSLIP